MAHIIGECKVIFSGLWRSSPRTDVDRQLRLISDEFQKKPGLPASFQITTSGVEMYIISENGLASKNKKVGLKDIYDVIVNKYHPLCLMVVYSDDKRTHNFLVCQCYSEADGIQLSTKYRECKRKNGDQKNTGKDVTRQNWVLKPKHVSNNNEGESDSVTSTEKAESSISDGAPMAYNGEINNDMLATSIDSSHFHAALVHETDSERIDGRSDDPVVDSVPSQNGHADFDGESLVSIESYNSMKEELIILSQEVRNIKALLQQQGIRPETLQLRGAGAQTNGHAADGEKRSPSSSPKSGASDRRVNFAVDDNKGLGESKRGMYVKNQHIQGTSSRNKPPIRPYFYRSGSSGNSATSPSPGYAGANDVFDYPQKVSTNVSVPAAVPQRRSSKNAGSTTIHKPIEQVYQMQPRQHMSKVRRQIVIHPGQSSTLPAVRRTVDLDKGGFSTILNNGH